MKRTGSVVSVVNDIAEVELERANCSRCEKGRGCAIKLLPTKDSPLLLQCRNSAGANEGDQVEILIDLRKNGHWRVYAVYLLPLAGLLLGALLGSLMATQLSYTGQLLPSIGAIIGFAGGLFAYPAYNCEHLATDLQAMNPRISKTHGGRLHDEID